MRQLETEFLLSLDRIAGAEEAGHKALSLAELARERFCVPETRVLPPDAPLPDAAEVLRALGGCVAVRSSATAEDLPDASFAGQFESFLWIETPDALIRAIKKCRESVRTPSVTAYCAARGLDPSGIRMAVILQRMIRADAAGVLFTVHPTTGREDETLIEACPGVADELLAGRRSGFRIAVRRNERIEGDTFLPPDSIRRLVELGRRIQEFKGAPQDVEWAIEKGKIFILQARPITRIGFGGIEGEWTNADFRDGGVSSDAVTPLVWSLYESVWEESLKGFLRELRILSGDFDASRVFYGRPYWNLGAVKRCVRKLPGFVEREFDRDLAVQPRYSGDGIRTPVRLGNLLRSIPIALSARRIFRRQESLDREILRAEVWRGYASDPAVLGDRELLGRFRDLVGQTYRTVEVNYFRTIFCASIAKMDLRSVIEGLPISVRLVTSGPKPELSIRAR